MVRREGILTAPVGEFVGTWYSPGRFCVRYALAFLHVFIYIKKVNIEL
jgi:hypothetical protein